MIRLRSAEQSRRQSANKNNAMTVLRWFVTAVLCGCCASLTVSAETIDQKEEYARRIKTANVVGALGNSLFGDETTYYTGTTTFTQVDIDLSGNNNLPVRVARTWSSAPPEGPTAPGLFGEWELDIPYVHGVFARNKGWQVTGATPYNRCSAGFAPPTASADGGSAAVFGGEDYWRGHSLYVPGFGDQAILQRTAAYTKAPADGQTYRWVTVNHWQLRCVPLAAGQVFQGEGFLALAPDGTKYRFDWMVARPYSTIQRGETLTGPGGGTVYKKLSRDQVRIYPTRIEDRFGNWVTYTYSGEKVTEIRSSDNRVITFTYHPTHGTIASATAAGRSWQYEYSSSRRLTDVVNPDASAWSFDSPTLIIVYQPTTANSGCGSMGEWIVGDEVFTMTHPSGATAAFTFAPTRHYRNTPYTCQIVEGLLEYGPPRATDNYALIKKVIAGPGLAGMEWQVAYDSGCAQCTSRSTTITHPNLTKSRHTFGTRYYVDEGKLLRTETLTSSNTVARDEGFMYAISPTNPPYAYVVGWTGMNNEDAFGSTRVVPKVGATTNQDGVRFSWNVAATCNGNNTYCLDSFARPTKISRSSAPN